MKEKKSMNESTFLISDALRSLVPSVQFKKREKQSWRSLRFVAYNFTKCIILPWVVFTIFKLYKWYQIAQSVTYNVLEIALCKAIVSIIPASHLQSVSNSILGAFVLLFCWIISQLKWMSWLQVFKAAWSKGKNDQKIEFHDYLKAVRELHQERHFLQ